MPLVFHTAKRAVGHFAEITQGRSTADEGMNFLLAGSAGFDAAEDHLELLSEDTLDFKKLIFVLGVEFFSSSQGEKLVELFPALEVALHLQNQLFNLIVSHSTRTLYFRPTACGERKIIAPPRKARAVNFSAEYSATNS